MFAPPSPLHYNHWLPHLIPDRNLCSILDTKTFSHINLSKRKWYYCYSIIVTSWSPFPCFISFRLVPLYFFLSSRRLYLSSHWFNLICYFFRAFHNCYYVIYFFPLLTFDFSLFFLIFRFFFILIYIYIYRSSFLSTTKCHDACFKTVKNRYDICSCLRVTKNFK